MVPPPSKSLARSSPLSQSFDNTTSSPSNSNASSAESTTFAANITSKSNKELDLDGPDSTPTLFANVLHTLESASSNRSIVPKRTIEFLQDRIEQLKRPQKPFQTLTTPSSSKGTLVASKVENTSATLSAEDKSIVEQLETRFRDCDQRYLIQFYRLIKNQSTEHVHPTASSWTEEDWDSITALVFEERMAVLGIVASLLRAQDDPDTSNPINHLSNELLPSIVSNEFTVSILNDFSARTKQQLPNDSVRTSPTHSSFWTKQFLREQKALLEILFLVFYSPLQQPPDGPVLTLLLETIQITHWGQSQELFGYFDAESNMILNEIGQLLTILAIESFNLELVIEVQYPLPSPVEKPLAPNSIFSAQHLRAINEKVEDLVRLDQARASPILLGWTYILSKVTASLIDRGVPEAYHEFASQSLRVETSGNNHSGATATAAAPPHQPLYQLYAAHALSPPSNLFNTLTSILDSSLIGGSSAGSSSPTSTNTTEPNAVGYLSVLRGLITPLPLLVRLSFLTPEQLDAHFRTFAALFGNRSAAILCAQFWQDQGIELLKTSAIGTGIEDGSMLGDSSTNTMMLALQERTNQMEGELETISIAQARFPIQFGGFIRLVKSLCIGVSSLLPSPEEEETSLRTSDSEAEELVSKCAQTAFEYLAALDSLTCIVPSSSSSASLPNGLPYEVASYPEISYRTTKPFPLSKSVAIPVGTKGKLVSRQGAKPIVVAWNFKWSAWRLFGNVLENYAAAGSSSDGRKLRSGALRKSSRDEDVFGDQSTQDGSKGLPIEWSNETDHEEDVVAVLDIFRAMLRNDPSLGSTMMEHLSIGRSTPIEEGMDEEEEDESNHRFAFVENLFIILDRALATQRSILTSTSMTNNPASPTVRLVSSLLDLIAALLPSYPGVCWTLLRGSTLLFPSMSNDNSASWSLGNEGGAPSANSSILANERLTGHYPITLSLLALVRALVLEDQVTSAAIEDDYRRIKQGVLARALEWIRDEVWPSYSSWRFVDLTEKFEIAKRITSLYSLILEEAELSSAVLVESEGAVVNPAVKIVVDALLFQATVGQLNPLLATISNGPDPIVYLRKALRYAEAEISEDLAIAALSLMRRLLKLRRRIPSISTSLLEKLALSHSNPEGGLSFAAASSLAFGINNSNLSSRSNRGEWLETLSKYTVAPVQTSVAIQACKTLTLLCLGSGEWAPRPPSLIALMGGAPKSEKWVSSLLTIAGDPLTPEGLQVAIWDMISSIVETQPSFAILVVTGRHFPFSTESTDGSDPAADSKALTANEVSARALHKSLAPPSFKPLPRTALGVALETIGTWNEAWNDQPALLASVLRFFDFTFQHILDYGDALDDFRRRPAPWDALVKIAFKSLGETEPSDDLGVKEYCHRVMAKAHAVRVLALDAAVVLDRPSATEAASSKALLKALSNKVQLSNAIQTAMDSSCTPELQNGVFELLQESFPEVEIDSLRRPSSSQPLEDDREYGRGYVYSLSMLRRRLDGFMADSNVTMLGPEALGDVIEQTSRLNLNLSLVDAQISHTRSWHQLLEITLPLIRQDKTASAVLLDVGSELVAQTIADEDRGGQIILTVQSERLAILLMMVEVLQGLELSNIKYQLVTLVEMIGRMFLSDTLRPLESVQQRSRPMSHPTLFRIAFFAYRKLSKVDQSVFSPEQVVVLISATETLLKSMITATCDLFVIARTTKDLEVEQDMALAVAVVSQLVHSHFASDAIVWLGHCREIDFFRSAFAVFVDMAQIDGRPLYAQHVLDLCLSIASCSPRAAEQMALEGLMTALTNNALSAAAEAGAIAVISQDGAAQRTVEHELWTSMLELVVALVAALGESTQFIEQEVIGFIRLHGLQFAQAMSWTADSVITLPGLEELVSASTLMHGVIRRATSLSASIQSSRAPSARENASGILSIAAAFAEQSLHVLQHIVYAILHPNHLANLIEPTNPEERSWIEKDMTTSSEAGSNDDLGKRPVVAVVTLALVQLARTIIESLISYTEAFKVLLTEATEWDTNLAIIMPTATVSTNEKASIGTLFDLASFCLDTLRQTPSASPPQSTSLAVTSLVPYSTKTMNATVAQTLEAVLLLSASQLALWLSRPDPTPTRATMAMRREITGELATDLSAILDRAGAKGASAVGGLKGLKEGSTATTTSSVEIFKVLKGFVVGRLVDR